MLYMSLYLLSLVILLVSLLFYRASFILYVPLSDSLGVHLRGGKKLVRMSSHGQCLKVELTQQL